MDATIPYRSMVVKNGATFRASRRGFPAITASRRLPPPPQWRTDVPTRQLYDRADVRRVLAVRDIGALYRVLKGANSTEAPRARR